jgi:hypothetical protein
MAIRLQYVTAGGGGGSFHVQCDSEGTQVLRADHSRRFLYTLSSHPVKVESKIRYIIKVSSTFFCIHVKFLIYICLVLGVSQEVADHQSYACRPLHGGRQTAAVSGQTNQQNWSNYHRPHIKIPNGVYRMVKF